MGNSTTRTATPRSTTRSSACAGVLVALPLMSMGSNFGNIDGYPAAAQRYTECRLAKMASELLRDIDADTVDFGPNYDESRNEPQVLPTRCSVHVRIPLCSSTRRPSRVDRDRGRHATNIPPHNLGEVTTPWLR